MRPDPEFACEYPSDAPASAAARRIVLPLDRTVALRDVADGCVVRCLAGCCWLTLRHDPRDIVLGPGVAFAVARGDAPVVLTGLSHAPTVLVVEPAPAGPAS